MPTIKEDKKRIPAPVLRRLPIYQHYLKGLQEDKVLTVSCTQIAKDLKLTSIQIRKDLAMTGIVGKPKVGYIVEDLLLKIEKFLGWQQSAEAFVVGVGHLGAALLGYDGFTKMGLQIIAGFDNDTNKIGSEIYGKKIFAINRLSELVSKMNIHIGIITVPAKFAQEIADIMVKSGIKAIWNFADIRLSVPDGVIVQHENLASSLAVLSKRLQEELEENTTTN